MRKNTSRAIGLLGAFVVTLSLSSCATSPTHGEVAKRMEIEMEGVSSFEGVWEELADGLATDALNGLCGSEAYRVGLGDDPNLLYTWDVVCLSMFEDQLSAAQIERAKRALVDRAVETWGESE